MKIWKESAVPPESTASEIQLLTDANVTFHDVSERNGRAACVEAFGANSDDVPMFLRICDAKLEEVSGPRDTVSSQVFKPKRNFLGTPKDGVNAGVLSPRRAKPHHTGTCLSLVLKKDHSVARDLETSPAAQASPWQTRPSNPCAERRRTQTWRVRTRNA